MQPTLSTARALSPTAALNIPKSGILCAASAVRSQLGFAVDEHAQRPPPLASIGANFAADVQQAHEAGKFKVHKIVGDGRCMFRATVRLSTVHMLMACGRIRILEPVLQGAAQASTLGPSEALECIFFCCEGSSEIVSRLLVLSAGGLPECLRRVQ